MSGFELLERVAEGPVEGWRGRASSGQAVMMRLSGSDGHDALQREASVLLACADRRIPRLLLVEEGLLVLVPPEGVPLRLLVDAVERQLVALAPAMAVDIALELAHGLRKAHTAARIAELPQPHGRISPDRVYLEPDGNLLILDLGNTGEPDPGFAAPELAGSPPTLAVDQWGVARLLLELVAAPVPVDADFPHIAREVESRLPALGALLSRALSDDPDERYAQESDFIRALHRLSRDTGGPSARKELFTQILMHRRALVPLTTGRVVEPGEPPKRPQVTPVPVEVVEEPEPEPAPPVVVETIAAPVQARFRVGEVAPRRRSGETWAWASVVAFVVVSALVLARKFGL